MFVITLVLLCVAGVAAAQNTFLYNYHGNVWEVGNFGALGSTAYAVGQVDSIAPILVRAQGGTWTWYLSNLVAQSVSQSGNNVTVCYSGGTIELHEDVLNNPPYQYGSTTPPNDVSPSTFLDGPTILIGSMSNFCITQDITKGKGTFNGDVAFTGGTQVDQLPTRSGWTFGADFNNLANPGYEHFAVGQVQLLPITPVQPTTWGHIKAIYNL
jgi:hypothetical protein